MAFFEDIFKGGNIVAGLAIGVGAAVLAPVVIPALRPLASGDQRRAYRLRSGPGCVGRAQRAYGRHHGRSPRRAIGGRQRRESLWRLNLFAV